MSPSVSPALFESSDAKEAVLAYEAAKQVRESKEQELAAAEALEASVRYRDSEIATEAHQANLDLEEIRSATLDAILDSRAHDTALVRRAEDRHRMLITACDRSKLWRLPDARRAVLVLELELASRTAQELIALRDLRRILLARAVADLTALEGSGVTISAGASEALDKDILSARERAAEALRRLDEHDARIKKLRGTE